MAQAPHGPSPSPGAAPTKAALGEGLPANVDVHRLGEDDNPQLDWDAPADEPAEEVAYSANHANRPHRTEAMRGRGARTLERLREIIRGGLYR